MPTTVEMFEKLMYLLRLHNPETNATDLDQLHAKTHYIRVVGPYEEITSALVSLAPLIAVGVIPAVKINTLINNKQEVIIGG